MYKFDRMEFPKKYPIPGWLKLFVLATVLLGILIHNCAQDNLEREIAVKNVRITGYSRVHVEVAYTLVNKARVDREVWLLLEVLDDSTGVLGSTLFMTSIRAGQTKSMLKVLDKLNRGLEPGEKPAAARIKIYKRKILS
jgi:hypothetical protein